MYRLGDHEHIHLIVSFTNTLDIEAGTDIFQNRRGLLRWLVDQGMATPEDGVDLEDQVRLVEVRDAVRELIASDATEGTGLRILEVANRAAGRIPLYLAFTAAGGVRLQPRATSPADHAIGAILVAVYRGHEDGLLARLKVCRNPGCRWVFYDRSKNQARRWCEMAVCGNRAKAVRFRARRKSAREAWGS